MERGCLGPTGGLDTQLESRARRKRSARSLVFIWRIGGRGFVRERLAGNAGQSGSSMGSVVWKTRNGRALRGLRGAIQCSMLYRRRAYSCTGLLSCAPNCSEIAFCKCVHAVSRRNGRCICFAEGLICEVIMKVESIFFCLL